MVTDMRLPRLRATALSPLEGGVTTEAHLSEQAHDDIVICLIVGDEDGLHRLLGSEHLILIHSVVGGLVLGSKRLLCCARSELLLELLALTDDTTSFEGGVERGDEDEGH